MDKRKIKLVASDLDGTLLDSDKNVTKKTLEIIDRLTENGIMFVPATGRVLSSVPKTILDINGIDYMITSNGASTNHMPSGEEIFSSHLSYEDIHEVLEMINNRQILIEIFTKGQAYTDRKFLENLSSYGITGPFASYTLETRRPITDIISYVKENPIAIENINLIFNDNVMRDELLQTFLSKNFASITSSSPHNIEISNISATKGNALKKLCEELSIPMEEVMCFGDEINDTHMLKECGYSFAMNNSSDYVKSCAKYCTGSCDEDGVAKAIEKFIFSS